MVTSKLHRILWNKNISKEIMKATLQNIVGSILLCGSKM